VKGCAQIDEDPIQLERLLPFPKRWFSRVRSVRRAVVLGLLFVSLAAPFDVRSDARADDFKRSTANGEDPRDDSSPWGVASGAEWFSAYPTFNPVLARAGVRWLRGFYEWQTVQPKEGYWNWALYDHLVENARLHKIHLTGVFAYFAPWASADGGTRRFPIKNIQFWRDYVAAMIGRYHADIKYWEVWNEFNGSFAENGSVENYAELVREAFDTAKKIDPTAKIGLSVANFDVGFLDAAIKAGARDHFDYVCVHPYEKMGALANGGESAFLNMATTLRDMLAANNQSSQIPLWITEIGSEAPVKRNDPLDRTQAALLAKSYILAIASGFQRVFWFEARGPSYGKDTDLGLIRENMTPRPSLVALQTLTKILGPQPVATGWLNIGDGGYGFVFLANGRNVLAVWAPPGKTINTALNADAVKIDLEGNETNIKAGTKLVLPEIPMLVADVPIDLVQEARSNLSKPYPWDGNVARQQIVRAQLKIDNVEDGVKQINVQTTSADRSWRRLDFSIPGGEGHYAYFSVSPQFATYGTKSFEITAVVKRISPDKLAGLSLDYESQHGYINKDYQSIPESNDWREISWTVTDANFVGGWGWNFRINAIASPNEFLVKEIRVRKLAS
jgi:polysaccharide biosynthesis protein PslG